MVCMCSLLFVGPLHSQSCTIPPAILQLYDFCLFLLLFIAVNLTMFRLRKIMTNINTTGAARKKKTEQSRKKLLKLHVLSVIFVIIGLFLLLFVLFFLSQLVVLNACTRHDIFLRSSDHCTARYAICVAFMEVTLRLSCTRP